MIAIPDSLNFFKTQETPCSYLHDKVSSNLLIDPKHVPSRDTTNALLNLGFRRSGTAVYRPNCSDCNACVATRIPVDDFTPSRGQRRCLNKNRDISIEVVDASYQQPWFDLYKRYLESKHLGGGMDDPQPEHFSDFLFTPWSNSKFILYKLNDSVVGIACTDFLPEGLSAVYTWYEPDLAKRSLGTFSILQQIQVAKQQGLQYLYMGYWIESCQKMSYKTNFQLIEGLINNEWQLLGP